MLLVTAVMQHTDVTIPVESGQLKFLCLPSPRMAGSLLKSTPVAEQLGSELDK